MKCPFCGIDKDRVIDSRSIKGGEAIRRRRECDECGGRFTSYEQIERTLRMVIKKDGRREPFDRDKVFNGLQKAFEKRPVGTDRILEVVDEIENEVFRDRPEVPSRDIGERILTVLHDIDEVAYVRFASVYRQFCDVTEFMTELKTMLGQPGRPAPKQNQKPEPKPKNKKKNKDKNKEEI